MGSGRMLQKLMAILLIVVLGLSLVSCSTPQGGTSVSNPLKSRFIKLAEVPPPPVIRELRQAMEGYQPQVQILSPRSDEVLQDTEVSVRFRVKDLPLFQNETLGLGPHLHVIVDNQPYLAVYNADEPLVLKDLEPGTHTIRAFASRPWHESFKNEGAYAQTTFHLFAKTLDNRPKPGQPVLTYSRPKGSYGAEPIMLDFYLANAPLHLIAKEDAEDDILDWQVRCTINGESFIIDRWEPIYLKGLKPGKHWVQLELLNENGEPYSNAFSNTVRLIDYQPGGTDTLSQLTRGDVSVAEVLGIVDPTYVYTPEPEIPEPDLNQSETSEPETPEPEASELETPELKTSEPESASSIAPEPFGSQAEESAAPDVPSPASELEPEPISPVAPEPEMLPPEILAPTVEEPASFEPSTLLTPEPNKTSQSTLIQPDTSDREIIESSAVSAPMAETDQEHLPAAMEELLRGQDPETRFHLQTKPLDTEQSAVVQPDLEQTAQQEAIAIPLQPELLTQQAEAAPAIAPPLTPIPPAPVPDQPEVNQPLLRQWRDRLKQFVPLPDSEDAKTSKPSLLKGISDRTRSWFGNSSPQVSPAPDTPPLDPTLVPQIIDVPSDEELNTPIAEP